MSFHKHTKKKIKINHVFTTFEHRQTMKVIKINKPLIQ